jgi:hypothetical protein
MMLRLLLILLLSVAAALPAAAQISFKPEVLLMKGAADAVERSFQHATLRNAAVDPQTGTAMFRYRAENDIVTCTVRPGPPDRNGIIMANVRVQRHPANASPEEVTTVEKNYGFFPGKSLIVDTFTSVQGADRRVVEMLQITLVAPESPSAGS